MAALTFLAVVPRKDRVGALEVVTLAQAYTLRPLCRRTQQQGVEAAKVSRRAVRAAVSSGEGDTSAVVPQATYRLVLVLRLGGLIEDEEVTFSAITAASPQRHLATEGPFVDDEMVVVRRRTAAMSGPSEGTPLLGMGLADVPVSSDVVFSVSVAVATATRTSGLTPAKALSRPGL